MRISLPSAFSASSPSTPLSSPASFAASPSPTPGRAPSSLRLARRRPTTVPAASTRPTARPEPGVPSGPLGGDEVGEEGDVQPSPNAVSKTDEAHRPQCLRNVLDLRADEREERERKEAGRDDRLLPDAVSGVPRGDRADDRTDQSRQEQLEGIALARAELVHAETREVRKHPAGA